MLEKAKAIIMKRRRMMISKTKIIAVAPRPVEYDELEALYDRDG
jgi:hypothetical protein